MTIEENLDTIEDCAASLRADAEKHGRLGIYKADCLKIADTTDALIAEVRLLGDALDDATKPACYCRIGEPECKFHRLARTDRKLGEE